MWRQHYYASHIHTLLLFTWTDYKTIFLPIVSTFHIAASHNFLKFCDDLIDGIRICHGPSPFVLETIAGLHMDMVPYGSLQRLQSSRRQRGGCYQPAMEAFTIRSRDDVSGHGISLDNGHALHTLVCVLWHGLSHCDARPCHDHLVLR